MLSSMWKICHETRHSVYVSQTLGLYDLIHPHPALPSSCNERAPVRCDCGPVAMIVGRTVPTSCNQCGPAGAMIAVPSADVCRSLHVAVVFPILSAAPERLEHSVHLGRQPEGKLLSVPFDFKEAVGDCAPVQRRR